MELKLSKPLVVFDLETTGLVIGQAHIVEMCMIKVETDGREEERCMRFNPGVHIPEETTAIHGISDNDVKDCPTFAEVANKIAQFIGNADLCGYNSNKFDVPLLVEEFMRAGVDFPLHNRRFLDVQNIFHKMEPRTLSGAVKFYLNRNLEDAHTAGADTRATLEVLKAQLDKYEGVKYIDRDGKESVPVVNDIKALADFTANNRWADLTGYFVYDKQGRECFNFGKFKGRVVEEVFREEPAYYDWIMKSEFPLSTKRLVSEIRMRRLNAGMRR